MAKQEQTAITPTRNEDYPEWYQQVVKASDLAEKSPVRGCMIIKPWGYALWENMVRILDDMFKATGVKNAYFPLFIPLSFMEKEAQHVEGFATECAVVTHHRLEKNEQGALVPAGILNEPLVVRPTSETIIGDAFAKWVSSYRDLPVLINQWANVVRWEMRTRIFLRTTEFLWQEGHTAHATDTEAIERTHQMLTVYADFVEKSLAIPVLRGVKSPAETFPGAVETLCIEAMMQDRKALQMGTSHFLGQNFARASGIRFQNRDEKEEFAWTTSWGASTRMIGGTIMTHGDDNGIILPPRVASSHIVIIPIFRSADDQESVMTYCRQLADELRQHYYYQRRLIVEIDDRDTGGARGWDWIKKGIPIRIEVGPRDIEKNEVVYSRRDQPPREKTSLPRIQFVRLVTAYLDDIQNTLFDRALAFQKAHTRPIDSREDFYAWFTPENPDRPEIHAGFAQAHWCGAAACEARIKEDLRVTIRCIPFDAPAEKGTCVCCGQASPKRAVFAKAY